MTASVVATLESVFSHVEVTPIFPESDDPGIGNLAVLAYDAPFVPPPGDGIMLRHVHPDIYPVVKKYIGRRYRFPPATAAVVLTDDYNPVDFHDLWLKEMARKDVLGHTDADILL